jgi:hypothetical protein
VPKGLTVSVTIAFISRYSLTSIFIAEKAWFTSESFCIRGPWLSKYLSFWVIATFIMLYSTAAYLLFWLMSVFDGGAKVTDYGYSSLIGYLQKRVAYYLWRYSEYSCY